MGGSSERRVTGDPAEVESVCNVLALTVELLLRNEQHRDSSRWREAAVRELLLGLVNGTVTENGLLEALRHIGSPMTPPWNITAVVPASGSGSSSLPSSTSVACFDGSRRSPVWLRPNCRARCGF